MANFLKLNKKAGKLEDVYNDLNDDVIVTTTTIGTLDYETNFEFYSPHGGSIQNLSPGEKVHINFPSYHPSGRFDSSIENNGPNINNTQNQNTENNNIVENQFSTDHILSKTNLEIIRELDSQITFLVATINCKTTICKNIELFIKNFIFKRENSYDDLIKFLEDFFYNYAYYNKDDINQDLVSKFDELKPDLDDYRHYRYLLFRKTLQDFNNVNGDNDKFYLFYKEYLNDLSIFFDKSKIIEDKLLLFLRELKDFIESFTMPLFGNKYDLNLTDINQISEWLGAEKNKDVSDSVDNVTNNITTKIENVPLEYGIMGSAPIEYYNDFAESGGSDDFDDIDQKLLENNF